MRQRATITIALVFAALLAGAGLATALGGMTTQSTTDGGSTITVAASGSAEAAPDRAVLRVAVVATGDSATEARKRLAANVSSMREALADAGVTDAQVRTTRYDLSRNHRARERPDAPAYRGYHSFQITLNDTAAVGRVIDAAVAGGATRIEDIQFTLSNARASQVRAAALSDAMTSAHAQAGTLANASDLRVTGVASVETSPDRGRPVGYETAAAGAGDTTVESGSVSVVVNVRVTYNATRV